MAAILESVKEKAKGISRRAPREGAWTKNIEWQTAKIPSVFFLNLGIGTIIASAALAVSGERYRKLATFIGLWVPTFLLLGIYNKIVKIEGSDRFERP